MNDNIAVLYMRYSSSSQSEQSIEGQNAECEEYCKKHGLIIIHKYIDRATSAYKDIDKRREFLQMIEDSKKRNFSYVVVWSLDRFSRKTSEMERYREELTKNGVEILSVTEHISSEPSGIIMRNIFSAYAEYYSAELSRKVDRGQIESVKKGLSLGGYTIAGLKVVDKRYEIDEVTGPYILRAFEMFDEGKGKKAIADYLNANGVKNGSGGKQTVNTVDRMLKNEKYIGVYEAKGIRQEGVIPQLIPVDLFWRVNKKLEQKAKNKKYVTPNDYFLSGQLYCGKCGNRMVAYAGTSKTSKRYLYYKCKEHTKGSKKYCSQDIVNKEWLEETILTATYELFKQLDRKKLAHIAHGHLKAMVKSDRGEILKRQISEDEKKAKSIAKMIAKTGSDLLLNELTELEQSIKDNKQKLSFYTVFDVTEDDLYELINSYLDQDLMDEKNKKALATSLIAAVVYDKDDNKNTIRIFYSILGSRIQKAIEIAEDIQLEPEENEFIFSHASHSNKKRTLPQTPKNTRSQDIGSEFNFNNTGAANGT